jgi:hypothetical protein
VCSKITLSLVPSVDEPATCRLLTVTNRHNSTEKKMQNQSDNMLSSNGLTAAGTKFGDGVKQVKTGVVYIKIYAYSKHKQDILPLHEDH